MGRFQDESDGPAGQRAVTAGPKQSGNGTVFPARSSLGHDFTARPVHFPKTDLNIPTNVV